MNKATSESLAATIISNRILGLNLEQSKICMSELLRRREEENDQFEFEKYIDEKIKLINDTNKNAVSNNEIMKFMSLISSVGKQL